MNIFRIFKRRKDTQQDSIVLQATATLYPDKILIETVDSVKEGFGITSNNITTLPVDTDNNTLGSTLRHHLKSTRTGLTRPKDYKKHYQEFLNKAGFKNGKDHHKNALHLAISQRQDKIILCPTKNGGYTGNDRGFVNIKDSVIMVSSDIDNSMLAEKVKEGWNKCECNCT